MLIPYCVFGSDTPGGNFALTADSVVLDVAPRAPGRTFLQLPPLEFRFRVRLACADGGEPASFALNVADSRIALNGVQLAAQASSSSHELRLKIPAEQLAPIALAEFCVAATQNDDSEFDANVGFSDDRNEELLVPAALAAQASLLCVSGDAQTMTYISAPLDLRLVCSDVPDGPRKADPILPQ